MAPNRMDFNLYYQNSIKTGRVESEYVAASLLAGHIVSSTTISGLASRLAEVRKSGYEILLSNGAGTTSSVDPAQLVFGQQDSSMTRPLSVKELEDLQAEVVAVLAGRK